LKDLKVIAFHWMRLEENWNRPFPEIIGPIRTSSCGVGGPVDIISIVPGTDIVILQLRLLGQLQCWDVISAAPFNCRWLECNDSIYSASEPYEKQGEYAIALLTMQVHREK
jgi:hypothetical protein